MNTYYMLREEYATITKEFRKRSAVMKNIETKKLFFFSI
jgi:hypothetical protein